MIIEKNAPELARLRALSDQLSNNLSAVGAAYNDEKARAEKAEHELADHITALTISNHSADEQMRYKREAESKVEQLNLELLAYSLFRINLKTEVAHYLPFAI